MNTARPKIEDHLIDAAVDELLVQIARRSEQHEVFKVSRHEAYGILAEEFKELMDAIHGNEPHAQYEGELYDIAVACIFELASSMQRRGEG